jgi:hypothetical protein
VSGDGNRVLLPWIIGGKELLPIRAIGNLIRDYFFPSAPNMKSSCNSEKERSQYGIKL